jgi:uncharacterized membrane protein YtjA (UPF0391 family)
LAIAIGGVFKLRIVALLLFVSVGVAGYCAMALRQCDTELDDRRKFEKALIDAAKRVAGCGRWRWSGSRKKHQSAAEAAERGWNQTPLARLPPRRKRVDAYGIAMSLLKWALIFFLVSIVAGIFGFTGISAASADVARILFYIFVVIFLVLLILGLVVFRGA